MEAIPEVPSNPIVGNESDGKFAFVNVVDDRVHQNERNLYPIIKSNSTINQVPIKATSYTQALLSFQSPNIQPSFFVDRAITIQGVLRLKLQITTSADIAPTQGANVQCMIPGYDISPCAMPFNESVSLATTLLNDNTITTSYIQDTKDLLIRMSDYRKNLGGFAGPSCPDYAVKYSDVYLTNLNSCANINDINAFTGFIPNASYPLQFSADGTTWQSTPLTFAQIATANAVNNATNPLPAGSYNVWVRVPFNEYLLSSPWIYDTSKEYKDVALTGVKNFALNINMNTGSRVLRTIQNGVLTATNTGGAGGTYTVSGAQFDTTAFDASFVPQLNYMLLSAPESFAIERPLKNRVHMMTIERNLKQVAGLGVGASATLTSDIINLTRVPYLIAIGVRPQNYASMGQGDWMYALSDGAPINLSFNNVPGKCSTFNKLQLYNCARNHGLQESYITWSGANVNKTIAVNDANSTGSVIPLSQSWTLLQPGIDFSLDDISLSPGSVCNCPMQLSVSITNQTGLDYSATQSNFYVFCLYNDWCETDTVLQKSNVLTGIINSEAVLKADKTQPSVSENELMSKYLGGSALKHMKRAHRRHHRKHTKLAVGGEAGGKYVAGEAGGARHPVRHRRL